MRKVFAVLVLLIAGVYSFAKDFKATHYLLMADKYTSAIERFGAEKNQTKNREFYFRDIDHIQTWSTDENVELFLTRDWTLSEGTGVPYEVKDWFSTNHSKIESGYFEYYVKDYDAYVQGTIKVMYDGNENLIGFTSSIWVLSDRNFKNADKVAEYVFYNGVTN